MSSGPDQLWQLDMTSVWVAEHQAHGRLLVQHSAVSLVEQFDPSAGRVLEPVSTQSRSMAVSVLLA